VELTDLGRHLEVDAAIFSNGGHEVDLDPELLPFNGDRNHATLTGGSGTATGSNRYREFSAGEEAGLFPALRHQCGIGEDANVALLLEHSPGRLAEPVAGSDVGKEAIGGWPDVERNLRRRNLG